MQTSNGILKKRTLRVFKQLLFQYEKDIKNIEDYFEDEDIKREIVVDRQSSEQVVEDYLNSLDYNKNEDVLKLLLVIETFITINRKNSIESDLRYQELLEFLEHDGFQFDGKQFNRNNYGESNPEDVEEDGEEDDENSLNHLPEADREVFIEPSYFSIFELHRKYKRGDLVLTPFYQRENVWKTPKKSKLVESVLRKIPIPSLYFAETEDNKLEVVDGQQRLSAFFDFLDKDYKLTKLPVLTQLKGMSFDKLPQIYQRKLEDYQLHIFIINKDSHPDIRFDIFERINEGATQLNAQELRNSMYRNGEIGFLKKLAKNKYFVSLTKGKLQVVRLKDQEAVLRFLAFYIHGYDKYNGNPTSFLNFTLDHFPNNKNQLDEISNIFSETMQTILDVFGEKAFIKGNSRILNMSLFDILTYSFAQFPRYQILAHKEEIAQCFNELITTDEDFIKNKLAKNSVVNRFEKWLEILTNCMKGGI
ncbi:MULTISPECIES: DUF262 domain-containing protein [Bacillus cereus group]|uniref:DUF262 domain-containing protein n=1 Tax=Bacillus cereus group TaxID=86661 RepID=UPI000BEE701D|nr:MULTISPECIES: DUF262 domain-containing protein [Bacillus cereus group]PEC73674.1 hypothetical protein CON25_11365 [Bacillus thuringiensis]PGW26863.1 hypothetical protein COD88_15330 [Bacillus cereus]